MLTQSTTLERICTFSVTFSFWKIKNFRKENFVMQNDIKIFENEEFGQVRTILKNGDPWFVGKDIATVLGYAKPADTIRKRVDEEDRGISKMETPSGIQEMTIINESGLYSLIFGSKLDSARKFKRWVTSEVLPTLRKTGTYSVSTTYQYPVPAASLESATNAGRLFERIMRSEGVPPHEIAMVVRSIFLQAGIDVPSYVVKVPAYEQLSFDIVTG